MPKNDKGTTTVEMISMGEPNMALFPRKRFPARWVQTMLLVLSKPGKKSENRA